MSQQWRWCMFEIMSGMAYQSKRDPDLLPRSSQLEQRVVKLRANNLRGNIAASAAAQGPPTTSPSSTAQPSSSTGSQLQHPRPTSWPSTSIPEGGSETCSTPSRSEFQWKLCSRIWPPSKRAVSKIGWMVACISLVATILALSPAFKGQTMSQEALDLAKWDARREFIEQCKELMVYIPMHVSQSGSTHSDADLNRPKAKHQPHWNVDKLYGTDYLLRLTWISALWGVRWISCSTAAPRHLRKGEETRQVLGLFAYPCYCSPERRSAFLLSR